MPALQTNGCCNNWGQIFLSPGSSALLTSLPNSQSLDLFQVIGEGGAILISVTSTGVVNKNPVAPTGQCLFGRMQSRLASTASTAAIFADAFSQNNNQSDVLQVRTQGGVGVWHLDYTGVSFSS
jgi:hypothetical protein